MSSMIVRFPGGKRVDAEYAGITIHTDQPREAGGDGSAPAPFDLCAVKKHTVKPPAFEVLAVEAAASGRSA